MQVRRLLSLSPAERKKKKSTGEAMEKDLYRNLGFCTLRSFFPKASGILTGTNHAVK
jgi:hypothetical protein